MPFSLIPDQVFARYTDLTPQVLKDFGVELLLCDLDYTLAPRSMAEPDGTLHTWLEGCREAFSAALLSLYGQQPEEIRRETVSFLAKNLTKSQIVRTIELLQKYRGECAYNVGPGHVLGALAVELEDIF